MAMENYSPSHPTEEVDLDNSPLANEIIPEIVEKPIICNDAPSKSPENPKSDKARSRSRSCSRKRRSNSRSRNWRSRDRIHSRERRSRSRERRSRSRDHRQRSGDRVSRSREKRSRSREKRSRSREKRSRSREKRSRSRETRRYSRSRESPGQYRHRDSSSSAADRKNDNIFSKMTELSGKSSNEPAPKMKWSYDSDDDGASQSKPEQNKPAFDGPSRFEDMRPLSRRSDYNADSRSDDMRPLPRRNDFSNRRGGGDNNFRGGDNFRGGFGRNRPWEPRNARSGNFGPRNDQRFGRSSFGHDNDDFKGWQPAGRNDEDDGNHFVKAKKDWDDGDDDAVAEEQHGAAGGVVERALSPATVDNKGFAADSDEEMGAWNSDATKNSISEMLTIANLESQAAHKQHKVDSPPPATCSGEFPDNSAGKSDNFAAADSDEEFGAWGAEQKTAKPANDPPPHRAFPQKSDDNWSANKSQRPDDNNWSANKSQRQGDSWGANKSQRPDDSNWGASKGAPKADGFAEDSDEEFGAWGKDQKASATQSHQSMSEHKSDPRDTPTQAPPFYAQNQRQPFNRYNNNNNDGGNNTRFGNRRGVGNDYNRFQRPMHHERFNNSGGGGGGNYNSNNSGFNSSNNSNSGFSSNFSHSNSNLGHQKAMHGPPGQPIEMMPQLGMPIPPYNFNPTQRPPQWPPMNNMGGNMGGMNNMGSMGGINSMGGSMGGNMGGSSMGPGSMGANNMGNIGASSMGGNNMGNIGSSSMGPSSMGTNNMGNIGSNSMGGNNMGGPTGMGAINNFPPICNGQLPFSNMQLLPQMQFSPMNQLSQQPPMSMPSIMQTMSYIPPPPPASSQPVGVANSSSSAHQSSSYNSSLPKPGVSNNDSSNNLLETIMTNVGLSSKSIRLQPDVFKPQPPQQNKSSVSDSLSNIIKSAASTVLSRLVENSQKSGNNNSNNPTGNVSDSMSMSPPSPASSPPPPRQSFNPMASDSSEFILPPLPNYSDILKPSAMLHGNSLTNALCGAGMGHGSSGGAGGNSNNNLQSSEISEEKRNRSDFESKGDWQERIALEVKNFLRPAYMSKKINKSDYKEIMKRCVTKISRSGVTEINTEKIEKFVLSYVEKYQKFRRGKQHGVVSSSEHELVM